MGMRDCFVLGRDESTELMGNNNSEGLIDDKAACRDGETKIRKDLLE